jgi:hypothetical protein
MVIVAPRFASTNSPPMPSDSAAAIENGSGGGVPASQFMVAGTTMATPIAQISRPTTNSTGRRSSMRTHLPQGRLGPAGAHADNAGAAAAARDASAPSRCQWW